MNRRIVIVGSLLLAGCASGTSHVEKLARQVNALDAVAAAGIGLLVHQHANASPWEVEVAPLAGKAFRLTLRRAILAMGGEGEPGLLFRRHAENIAAAQSCAGYRVVSYEERIETVLAGARRVAEGVIECIRA